jgi:hypothetical protein
MATNNTPPIAHCCQNVSTLSSALDSSPISEMFDRRDQLPLGPHANRVLVNRSVDNLQSDKRRQFETLQTNADLGGALADRADVRRGGEDFVETARALFDTLEGVVVNRERKWVSVKLKRRRKVRNEIKWIQASHREFLELRQLAQLGRQPFELIAADL